MSIWLIIKDMNRYSLSGYGTGRSLFFRVAVVSLCLTLLPLVASSQVVVVRMIDVINDKAMYRGNSIHEAGFNMIKEDQARILELQGYISMYTTMMLRRESEKMESMLQIDDYFSGNSEWQEHFLFRAGIVRDNLDDIKIMIASFPRTHKLVVAHKKLEEDLEDAKKKFTQAMDKDGQENMMRNDERNHLAIIAEERLEQVARLTRDLYNIIPQTRKEIMEE